MAARRTYIFTHSYTQRYTHTYIDLYKEIFTRASALASVFPHLVTNVCKHLDVIPSPGFVVVLWMLETAP